MKNYQSEVEEAVKSIHPEKNDYQVSFETNKGNILVDLFFDKAPDHCFNILGLAKSGFYNNLTFHRIIDGFVIQAGCPKGDGTGGPGYNIKAEFNERPHTLGVLSMARAQDPNSAGSQFFICLGDVPYLNGNYTAFGKVNDTAGLEVVKSIGKVKTGAGDKPLEKVVILKAAVLETPKN